MGFLVSCKAQGCESLFNFRRVPHASCSTLQHMAMAFPAPGGKGGVGGGQDVPLYLLHCAHPCVPCWNLHALIPPPPGVSQSQRCSAYACLFKHLSNLSSTIGLHFYHTSPLQSLPAQALVIHTGGLLPS